MQKYSDVADLSERLLLDGSRERLQGLAGAGAIDLLQERQLDWMQRRCLSSVHACQSLLGARSDRVIDLWRPTEPVSVLK